MTAEYVAAGLLLGGVFVVVVGFASFWIAVLMDLRDAAKAKKTYDNARKKGNET